MTAVSLYCLKLGQNFPERDIITLCVAEEANYRGILFHTDKSDAMKMYCCGPGSFLVYATNSDTSGWTITRCLVFEENDEHNMAVSSPTVPPTNTKWVELPSSLLGDCKNMRLRLLTFPQVISFSTRANMMTIGR